MVALDSDAELLAVLAERAPATTVRRPTLAPSSSTPLVRSLVIAPMQLAQILGGHDGARRHARARARASPPGRPVRRRAADPAEAIPDETLSPAPRHARARRLGVLEPAGLHVRGRRAAWSIERRRQAVSPDGELEEETAAIAFDVVSAGSSRPRRAIGRPRAGRRRETIPETPDHIGSTVVLCRR